jgi:hypothetical protein
MGVNKANMVVRNPREPSEEYQAEHTPREGALLNDGEYKEAQNIIEEHSNKLSDAQKLAKLGYWEINHLTNEMTGSEEIFNIFEIPKINI